MKHRFVLLCLSATLVFAAIPAGYYDSAANKTGTDLRLALHNIIDGHTQKTYDEVWVAYATTDIDSNGYIWDMYTDIEFTYHEDQQGYISSDPDSTYNREHSWPKSWANETYPMYTDLFHLYPVQYRANSNRTDLPYGEVGGTPTYTSPNGTIKGDARSGLGYVGTVFEPVDKYKGDLARTYFYMSTRYYTEDSGWDSSAMTVKCEIRNWAMDMLLSWHHLDPVSQKELDRNEAVYAIQGNRNPFIDNPDYADSIWTSSDTSSGGDPIPDPTVLSPGDIAITGVNMDDPDQISVVFLVAINDGTVINFTDNGWLATNEWRTGEGVHTWTASSNYAAGDEIVITLSGPLLSTSGDQVIAYQNTSDMIAAINGDGAHVWQSDATSTNTSALPLGLTNGTDCVALDEYDNLQYNRTITSGSKAELLAAINDYTNWVGDNTTPYTLSSTGFTVTDVPTPITLINFNAEYHDGQIELNWRTESETSNLMFILYRNDKPIARIDGAGTTSEPHDYVYRDRDILPDMVYTYVLADLSEANREVRHTRESLTVQVPGRQIPETFKLGDNFPNPFNPTTAISYDIPEASHVNLTIYDINGNKITTLVNEMKTAGSYHIDWHAETLGSGIYFYRIDAGTFRQVKKCMLLK